MFLKKNLPLLLILAVIIFVFQFLLTIKHLEYGFTNDDWYVLAWYKQVVQDPLLDMVKAWREIGSHNFARVYYVGILFKIFGYDYPLYHIFNTFLKALAGLSVFPIIYLLYRKKFLAYLATFLFSIHVSSFGNLNSVFGGNANLVILSMNIFLAIYLWVARKHNFSLKIMFILLMFILLASFFDIPRFYPALLLLPFLEFINFWFNRSSTTIRAAIFRILFLYAPFIAVVLYSPQAAMSELTFNKIIGIFKFGNYQLFLSLFASYGSTFVPQGLLDQLSLFSRVGNIALYQNFETFLNFLLFRFLALSFPILYILGLLITRKPKWFIIRSLFLSIIFSILAFLAANNWIYLDQKVQAAVDPGTYFIPGIIGLFVFSTAISFFIEWLNKRDNYLVLTLSLAPILSLLYTFFTWILTGDNVIFTGVHAYLSIAAIGSSVYLSVIFYLAFQNLKFKQGIARGTAAILLISYLFFFLILNAQQINNYYVDWILHGYGASDQTRLQTTFWKEVGKEESIDKSPILIYLDTSADDGYYYGANFTWDIPPMLTVVKGLSFDPGGHCKSVITFRDFDKLRIEVVNGKKMVVQSACGNDRFYKPENFYAFKMINRNLVPIKSEIIEKLGLKEKQ